MSEYPSRFASVDSLQIYNMTKEDLLVSASIRVQQNAERATLVFLMCAVYEKRYGRQLKVAHSLGDGVFCIDKDGIIVTDDVIQELESLLRALLVEHKLLEEIMVSRDDLVSYFYALNRIDKIGVVKAMVEDPIPCYRCGEFIDYRLEDMQTDLTKIKTFGFRLYSDGFVLRTPTLLSPTQLRDWQDPAAQHAMFKEYTEWAALVGVDNIAKLNEIIYKQQVYDIKWVAEGLHGKKFARIAKDLVDGFPAKRIVTIAGPSSSNKTTFAKRLSIALRVNGYTSLVIEMDDFFRYRDETPFGSDGLRDFEAITALNVELLAERVHSLLKGDQVRRRRYDFKLGKGFDKEDEIQHLAPNSFLILEGIHGLNPELLSQLGRDEVVPIYVAPLTPLGIDNTHRFPTTDLRLIRRLIRDHKYRGYSARKTIQRWTSVRVGEEKNIFPYQCNAEMFFNSSLVYELPVLSILGKTLLAEATIPDEDEDPKSPIAQETTREAIRLLGLLNLFYPIPLEEVPHISCIREFVGGSDLKY